MTNTTTATTIAAAMGSFAKCYPGGRKARGRGFSVDAARAVIRRRNRRAIRRMARQVVDSQNVDGVHVMANGFVRIASIERTPDAFQDPDSTWNAVRVCR